MRILFRSMLTALCMLALCSTIQADKGNFVGPLNLSLSIKSDFTDNRDSIEDGKENFDFSIKPKIDAVFNTERLLLDFYYIPTYRYRDNPNIIQNENEWYHDFGLNINFNILPRLELRFLENFYITDDPSIDEDGITLRRDSSYLLNKAELGAIYSISRISHFDLKFDHSLKRYEEKDVAEESDEDGLTGSAVLWRQLSRTIGGMLIADSTIFNYESKRDMDRGFTGSALGLGLEKVFSPNIRGTAQLALQIVDYTDDGIDSRNSPRASISLQTSSSPAARLTTSASYQIRDSDVYPFASQENLRLQLKGEWDVTKRTSLLLVGIYELGYYDEEVTPSDAIATDFVKDTEGEEATIAAQAGIIYKIASRSMAIKLIQQYEDVDSEISESFIRNNTSLILTKFF